MPPNQIPHIREHYHNGERGRKDGSRGLIYAKTVKRTWKNLQHQMLSYGASHAGLVTDEAHRQWAVAGAPSKAGPVSLLI